MRYFLLLLAIHVSGFAAAEDPLVGLRFVDGQQHRLDDWPGQPVLIMYFCGHCPTAKAWMSSTAVEIGKKIESDHQAAQLVCVTPDLSGESLKAWAATNCSAIAGTALFAFDPVNHMDISTKNISQAELWSDGSRKSINYKSVAESVAEPFKASTAFRYQVNCDLTDSGKAAWWGVERGRPGAFATCAANAKKSPEAKAIVAAVEAVLVAKQDKLVAQAPSLVAYESLEDLCTEGAGLPSLKPASERLRVLRKDKSVAEELKAREIFRVAAKQANSVKPSELKAGIATLTELAARMPTTSYGARALLAIPK